MEKEKLDPGRFTVTIFSNESKGFQGGNAWLVYHVAQMNLSVDRRLDLFEPFYVDSRILPQQISTRVNQSDLESFDRLIYQGIGWIGNMERPVMARVGTEGYLIEVDQCGRYCVDSNGRTIQWSTPWSQLDNMLFAEALGPALLLSAALNETWTLHASAALFQGKLIAFLGESGNGKSTLARYLDTRPGWRLIADDVLPVAVENGNVDTFPHFPQLKIPAEQQPSSGLASRLPLHALYVIESPGTSETQIKVSSYSAGEAVVPIIRHTVASRLFDEKLLTHQFDFARNVASEVPIHRLSYPHYFDLLPTVAEMLEQNLV